MRFSWEKSCLIQLFDKNFQYFDIFTYLQWSEFLCSRVHSKRPMTLKAMEKFLGPDSQWHSPVKGLEHITAIILKGKKYPCKGNMWIRDTWVYKCF